MTRPAATGSGQLAIDQTLNHQADQPLTDGGRRNPGGLSQLGDAQRPRFAQQIEDADIRAFRHVIHEGTGMEIPIQPILANYAILTTQYAKNNKRPENAAKLA